MTSAEYLAEYLAALHALEAAHFGKLLRALTVEATARGAVRPPVGFTATINWALRVVSIDAIRALLATIDPDGRAAINTLHHAFDLQVPLDEAGIDRYTAPYIEPLPLRVQEPSMAIVPYVRTVRTNAKRGVSAEARTVTLGPYTLLLGPNGAGKTSVIQAVQVGLGGACDLGPRDQVRAASDILELAPGRGYGVEGQAPTPLFVELTVQDGDVNREAGYIARRWSDADGKWHAKVDSEQGVPGALPSWGVRGILSSSPDTREKALLGWMRGGFTDEDVLASLNVEFHPYFREARGVYGALSAVEALVKMTEDATSQRLRAAGRRGEESALEQPAEGAVGPSLADVEGWTTVWRAYPNALAHCETDRLSLAWGAIHAKHAQTQQAPGAVAAWEGAVAEVGGREPGVGTHRQALLLLNGITMGDVCPCCWLGLDGERLGALRTWHSQQAEAEGNAHTTWEVELGQARAALDGWRVIAASAPRTQAVIEWVYANYAKLATLGDPTLADVARHTEALAAAYHQGEGRAEAQRQAQALRTAAVAEHALWSGRVDALAAAREALVAKATTAFQERVQAYLPVDRVVRVVRSNEQLLIGFEVDGTLHTDLSGAERVLLEVALTCAVCGLGASDVEKKGRGRPKKTPQVVGKPSELRVVIPRDVGWTPETLAKAMRAWSKFPGQVILESTVAPKGRTPEGWTIVEIEDRDEPVVEGAPEAVPPVGTDAMQVFGSALPPAPHVSPAEAQAYALAGTLPPLAATAAALGPVASMLPDVHAWKTDDLPTAADPDERVELGRHLASFLGEDEGPVPVVLGALGGGANPIAFGPSPTMFPPPIAPPPAPAPPPPLPTLIIPNPEATRTQALVLRGFSFAEINSLFPSELARLAASDKGPQDVVISGSCWHERSRA